MQQVGKFNAISKKLRDSIPPLKQGEVAVFQMLTGQKNNDPDEKERQKNPVLYPKANIPTRDRIKDPYAESGDGWVDLIVADYWEGDKPGRERFFMPGLGDGVASHQFTGKFQLTGGNQRDEELYTYLMICNYNEDSLLGEHRDRSKTPLFKVVDAKKASQKTLTAFDTLKQAIELVDGLKVKDAKEIAASLNWNDFADETTLMAEVKTFARTKPDEFLKVYNDPNKAVRATVSNAFSMGILNFDLITGKVKLGTEEITTIADQDRDNKVNAFTQFLLTAKNGKSVLKTIEAQVKDAKPELV